MLVRIRFFANFRDLFGGKERELVVSDGSRVRDVLEKLCDTPETRKQVYDGQLKRDVVVMKDGVPITSLQGLDTTLEQENTLAVFPLLGGG